MILSDGSVTDLQNKKASAAIANDFLTIDERDETHQVMMDIEPQL